MSGAGTPSQLGKYEIRGTLGKGAMGTVYDGWDPVIDRRVAIKTVKLPDADDEEAVEGLARFKREAQAAGRLHHPNIVGVFDYGETADLAYIVMEFVAGRSLKDVLAANERMAATDAASLMAEVLAGLAYSHGKGVVHRDIKPANIMLTPENEAKIADFGIARIEASSMTQAGTVMGTPAYMSPEQFMGQVVDRRTDIYSCGVLLYQLLTGERPFEGSMTSIMHKAMTTTPPRPSELSVTAPPALDPVVTKAMARRPEDRFDTAAIFAAALRTALDGGDRHDTAEDGDATTIVRPGDFVASPPVSVPDPSTVPSALTAPLLSAPSSATRKAILAAGVGGVVVLVALGGFYGMSGSKTLRPSHSTMAPVAAVHSAPIVSSPPVHSAADIVAVLANSLPHIGCSLAQAWTRQDRVVVTGPVQDGLPRANVRAAIAVAEPGRVDSFVQPFNGPFCPVLDALRPAMKAAGDIDQRLELARVGAVGPLKDNDEIVLKATMPNFNGFLHLAYLESDGLVSPLVPGAGYPQHMMTAGSTGEFGRAHPGFPGWRVGPPFGTDMILVVASTARLFASPLPASESIADYARALKTAIANLQRSDEVVAADALVLDTAPSH